MEFKTSDRVLRNSFLPFSLKSPNLISDPISSGDFGGSLMSDRGYDSDAQFVDSPKPFNISTENPYPSPSIWGSLSPLAQPYYETELDDLNEELSEDSPIASASFLDQNNLDRPQLPWPPQDYSSWGPSSQGYPTARSAEYGRAPARIGSPYATGFFQHRGQYTGHGSRGRAPGYPRRTPVSPVPYASSVDSHRPSPQLSVRKRRPPLSRELRSESQSVHLGDMDISRRLASPSSPRGLSGKSSLEELRRCNNPEGREAPLKCQDLASVETAQPPTGDAIKLNTDTSGARDESSSYSRKSSIMSGISKYHFETKIFNFPDTDLDTLKNPWASTSGLGHSQGAPVGSNGLTAVVAASSEAGDASCKSPGHNNAAPSVASPKADSQSNVSIETSAPRQVSVGWMSGGRRLGYGYALVPAGDDGKQPITDNSSLQTCDLNSSSTIGEGVDENPSGRLDTSNAGQNKTMLVRIGGPIFEITNMMHRLNFRQLSGAITSSGLNNISEAASNNSVTSLLWERIGGRRKGPKEPAASADQKPPWSHFCGVGLEPVITEPQSPLKDTISITENAEGQAQTGLHRARSLWAKGRTFTEKAHSLEAKVVTNIPSSIKAKVDLQRRMTQVARHKFRERKKTSHSLDEERPIFPDASQRNTSARVNAVEGQSITSKNTEGSGIPQGERLSSDTVADHWADAYEDCSEVHSIPE
ncbi:hypothetical protein BDV25DRAFT_16197 [Aspergillus avenaceus]|uniref:Uncharacterized protein n=1 Tax=Aspergillus avenaceus TaxID=36643 RepID=A0A5N6TQI9_ASPAV|nr:hypothetical protein BDV25DRAFT_16197 [Aspergillus avenaceus]